MIRDRPLAQLTITVSVAVLTFVLLQVLRLELLIRLNREVSNS